ncbi:SRPBCC family protein [Herbidospora mongoliensis]|uniref:SRPBCC family protein n=1 Tax=Herbidospora mongoliensis TaxID=688067 RepID=UPI00082F6302|nr:SRPBCC family protein [Herbidospora mongoliensis]
MNPTGRLVGHDLRLTRTFKASAADVWASVTESDRTARWFGPWRGDADPMIQVQLTSEEGAPWTDMRVEACEPPRRLVLSSVDEHGAWHLELIVTETDGVTELLFVQHLTDVTGVGDIGPGWEFYLDALVASREDAPAPEWDSYYPAMKPYYDGLVAE